MASARSGHGGQQVPVGRRQRVEGVTRGAAGQGQHPVDTRLRRQRVTQPDQQGGDAPVVAGARPADVAVDVGVQEELGDGQTGPGPAALDGVEAEVDRGEPGHVAEVALGRAEVPDHRRCGGVGRAVAERGDGGRPHRRVLASIGRVPEQRSAGERAGHQPEGLDQPAADRPTGRTGERPLDGERDLLGCAVTPLAERALREDAGEPAGDDDPDQPADGLDAGEPALEGPARVLAQEGSGVRQQLRQHGVRAVVEHLGQRVHGRDRGQLVGLLDHRGEQADRLRTAFAARGSRQSVPAAEHVHDERRLLDLVEGALKRLGHVRCSAPQRPRMATVDWSGPPRGAPGGSMRACLLPSILRPSASRR